MRLIMLLTVIMLLLGGVPCMAYESLQQLFNEADSYGEYDRYIVLDPDTEYSGDLRIMAGHSVCVVGNGARIYAQSNNLIQVGVYSSRLDIQNCVMIGGLGGIYFGTNASGTICNNTITGCSESGIRLFAIGSYNQDYVYDNIITDCYYGLFCNELERPSYLGYNTVYDIYSYRYAEFCPS